jgi:hypothetical protein
MTQRRAVRLKEIARLPRSLPEPAKSCPHSAISFRLTLILSCSVMHVSLCPSSAGQVLQPETLVSSVEWKGRVVGVARGVCLGVGGGGWAAGGGPGGGGGAGRPRTRAGRPAALSRT